MESINQVIKNIKNIKENNQDFEWYPTTQKMIQKIKFEINDDLLDILDCGAGDGRVLSALTDGKKFAIEKSNVLTNEMDPDIFVVGSDFWDNTLMDKKVDVIFCNPPYSEYKGWMKKILLEGNCDYIYLIVPKRWRNDKELCQMVEDKGECKELGVYDFLDADRKARAKIEIVKITIPRHWHSSEKDPFFIWAKKEFSTGEKVKMETPEQFKKKVNELVPGKGLIPAMVAMYENEMNTVQSNYKAISLLDPSIFEELKIDFKGIAENLKGKIWGMKKKYWHEIFDKLDPITSRLTEKSRENLLSTLTNNISVDFNEDNIYKVIMWAIKNANKYFDKQLIGVFMSLVQNANIIRYKSNMKTWGEDNWRFNHDMHDGKITHFKLDYRCIIERFTTFAKDEYSTYDFPNGLNTRCHNFLNDIVVVAKNLGFPLPSWEESFSKEWAPGKTNDFTLNRAAGEILMSVKAYKNGNVHIKFNQEFLKTLNVEFGRLKGWVRSPKEASEELGIKQAEVNNMFGKNFILEGNYIKLLEM